MTSDHYCTVCARSFRTHPEQCDDCGGTHWPPLCCPGCACRSHETAHPPKVAKLTVKEIAARIAAHLRRFEHDPKINVECQPGLHCYYMAGAYACGNGRVGVRYVAYQGSTVLTRDDAIVYLVWLDAGNVGDHRAALKKKKKKKK